MTRTKIISTITTTTTLMLALAGAAVAQPTTSVATRLSDTPILPQGYSVQAGGGVTGFIKQDARDYLGTGGQWEVRGIMGTRSFLGAELAYVGSVREVAASGLADSALLTSNGIEMTGRYNLPLYVGELRVEPFLFSGMGYSRLAVVNSSWNHSNVKSGTNALVLPAGGGLGLAYGGFALDLRLTYRKVIDDDTIKSPGQERTDLQSWSGALTLGYEL